MTKTKLKLDDDSAIVLIERTSGNLYLFTNILGNPNRLVLTNGRNSRIVRKKDMSEVVFRFSPIGLL